MLHWFEGKCHKCLLLEVYVLYLHFPERFSDSALKDGGEMAEDAASIDQPCAFHLRVSQKQIPFIFVCKFRLRRTTNIAAISLETVTVLDSMSSSEKNAALNIRALPQPKDAFLSGKQGRVIGLDSSLRVVYTLCFRDQSGLSSVSIPPEYLPIDRPLAISEFSPLFCTRLPGRPIQLMGSS